MSVKEVFLVFFGGGLGSICRYFLAIYYPLKTFPYVTLFINIFGSFCIGMLFSLLLKTPPNSIYKLILITGFCGGFTTFSTFSLEVFQLIQQHKFPIAIFYILASIILSLLAVIGGYFLIK